MKLLIFIIGFCFISSELSAQQFSFIGRKKRESLQFKLIKNLMVIPMKINGKGPFNFVLDTGVGLMLISDPTLVDSLKFQNLRTISIAGFGSGEPLKAFISAGIQAEIGTSISKNITAAILKNDVFELSSYLGMPIHGLIGFEFFNSFIIRIDYTQSLMTYYRHETSFIPRKGYRIPLSIEDRKPYLMTDIMLNTGEKVPIKLIIDTGAGHPIWLESREGLPFNPPAENITANLGIGLTGPISGCIGRITSLKLGRFELKNVLTAFPDYDEAGARVFSVSRNGNLGTAVLKKFNVVFDYSRSALYIKPSLKIKEPFEHDMSGLELAAGGDKYDRYFITRIEKGSAAEESGLTSEDELVAINFKPVNQMSLDEIDNLFRSRDGRSFILDIIPVGSSNKERIVMTLKRRI